MLGSGKGSFRFTAYRDACPVAPRYLLYALVTKMTEKDIHVVLVLEIEKYPILYNYKLAGYSRKDVTERVWSEISKKTNLSVNDCKEKWRNIRSTFLRSLKAPPSGSKAKKPYYLKEYLSFILPFVKSINESENPGNIPPPEFEEEHARDDEEVAGSSSASLPIISQGVIQSEDSTQEEPAATMRNFQAARKRRYNEVDNTIVKYLKKKIEKTDEFKESNKNQTTMNHFFLSVLPEFDDMTDNQIRTFKIKILQFIDEIKQGQQWTMPSTFRKTLPSTSRESLQSTSRDSLPTTCSDSLQSTYYQQFSGPHYSQISSVAHPEQPIPIPPSPVHMPYDLSADQNNNDDMNLTYENL